MLLAFTPNQESFYDSFFTKPPINFSCSLVATSDPHSALNYKIIFPYEVYDDAWQPSIPTTNRSADCIFYYSCSKFRESHVNTILSLKYSIAYHKQWGPNCDYYIFALSSLVK